MTSKGSSSPRRSAVTRCVIILASAALALVPVATIAQTPTPAPTVTATPTATPTVTPTATATQPDLRALVAQFWQVVSNGDVAGAAASFTPDATRYDSGTVLAVGRDAIQATFAKQAAQHPLFKVLSVQVSGNTTIARSERRDDQVRAAGIDRIIVVSTAQWRGDKMSTLDAVRDLTDTQTAQFTALQAAPAPAPAKTGNAGLLLEGNRATTPWALGLLAVMLVVLARRASWRAEDRRG